MLCMWPTKQLPEPDLTKTGSRKNQHLIPLVWQCQTHKPIGNSQRRARTTMPATIQAKPTKTSRRAVCLRTEAQQNRDLFWLGGPSACHIWHQALHPANRKLLPAAKQACFNAHPGIVLLAVDLQHHRSKMRDFVIFLSLLKTCSPDG